MARERKVTRTITTTTATVLTVNTETAETAYKPFVLTGDVYSNTDLMLTALKKLYETATEKLITVDSVKTTQNLYAMAETEFIKHATIVESRTDNPEKAEKVG